MKTVRPDKPSLAYLLETSSSPDSRLVPVVRLRSTRGNTYLLSQGKRIFIKDIIHYLLPPSGKPASIAPSLNRIKRGVGTQDSGPVDASVGDMNGNGVHDPSDHPNGVTNGANGQGAGGEEAVANGTSQTDKQSASLPYDTLPEPGNPTVMPLSILSRFHFAFLIRDPHYSVPSYYRCTIPPLDAVTGFHYYDAAEAGYDEVRRTFDYLRRVGLIGPHIATREDDADELDGSSTLRPVVGAGRESGAEICVVDADDMLDKPAAMMEAFCRSVGIEYDPSMLDWDNEDDHRFVSEAFEKWRGFHNDAIESAGLVARKHVSLLLSAVFSLSKGK